MEHCLKFNQEENNPVTKVVEGDVLEQKAQYSNKFEKSEILRSCAVCLKRHYKYFII